MLYYDWLVTLISGELDALTKVQPVVVGTVLSNPFGIVFGFPDCSECLLRPLLLVAYRNAGFKPVWVLSFSSAEGVHGGVLDVITDVILEGILDKALRRPGIAVLAVLM